MPEDQTQQLIAQNLRRGTRRRLPELTPEQRALRSAELIRRLEAEENRRNGCDPEIASTSPDVEVADPTTAAYSLNTGGEGEAGETTGDKTEQDAPPPPPTQQTAPPPASPTPANVIAASAATVARDAKAAKEAAKGAANTDDDAWQEPTA